MPSVKEIYVIIDKAESLVQKRGYNTKHLEAIYEPESNEIKLAYNAFSSKNSCHSVQIIHLDEVGMWMVPVDTVVEQMISLIERTEDALKEKKMDPETAIRVLKNLQDWLYLSSMANGTSAIACEAIDIGIAALEEKVGGCA